MTKLSKAEIAEQDLKAEQSLIEFPCDFPIKVMGESSPEFANTMLQLIQQHISGFDASHMNMRASTGGRFISLTCTAHVESKAQLDGLYMALSKHELVKFVL